MNALRYYRFNALWQRTGWMNPAYVGVDGRGLIRYISDKPPATPVAIEAVQGFALPGFQNAHSHAFQYAMAGLAETHLQNSHDDFWTWREVMYACALMFDPDEYEVVATQLYAEMLRHGYTHVAEFHYLHHDKNGKPYDNLSEMGERMLAAASKAGIKITLVPVFYQKGGFNAPPQARQRRFISHSADEYLQLLDDSANAVKQFERAKLGFSVHSLRAVDANDVVRTLDDGPSGIPFHIHVAEQKKEIVDCVAAWKQRPMQWLLNNTRVDERFNIIHATHLDDQEVKQLASSGATVVLCPSTEGNLGDGIFRMRDYLQYGGRWTIGTDSHIGLNPLEEFRMIDYRQRLLTNLRNPLSSNTAELLVNQSIENGRSAMGNSTSEPLTIDQPFDAVIFDAHAPLLRGGLPSVLPTLVFSSDVSTILGTIVNGKWIIERQHHQHEESFRQKFAATIRALRAKV